MTASDLRAHLERIAQSVAMLPDHQSPVLYLHGTVDAALLIASGFQVTKRTAFVGGRWESYEEASRQIGNLFVCAFTVHRFATAEEITAAEEIERAREGRAA